MPTVTSDEDDPLEILFAFHRYVTSHVIQTFLPSSLLVSASLGSLWVPSGLVPGRMALAVTTTLTLQSMINSVFTEAPRTSYLKALDIWLVTCFVFTFLVLIEYCVVLYLSRASDWYEDLKRVKGHARRNRGGDMNKGMTGRSSRRHHVAYLVRTLYYVLGYLCST